MRDMYFDSDAATSTTGHSKAGGGKSDAKSDPFARFAWGYSVVHTETMRSRNLRQARRFCFQHGQALEARRRLDASAFDVRVALAAVSCDAAPPPSASAHMRAT